ncbi:hypothetical protein CAPTEDRAFT_152305 [Capitella teleta]|uniref:Glutathione transferase n=1 Tax=Capitella teleta TaxID=283909 RepID=R7UV27_CAPTE|nr:hypothetical protein CAPTEDRAFT_152305 [Capitella teleta]|eukprot:ELU07797.1 hypothetical protein CAPTEDRAFT_152305 [Capitella teleta]
MLQYKVNYFDVKWLAEPIRMILSYGQLDFEDRRFTDAEWKTIKPTTPCSQAPFLDIEGGKRLAQTKAICRYLAKQTGLVPENDWDAARCDMAVDYADDFRNNHNFAMIFFYTEGEAQKLGLDKFLEDAPKFLANFEKLLKDNGSNGFLVGDKLTWADIYVSHTLSVIQETLKLTGNDLSFDALPQIKAFIAKVEAVPSIAAWIKKRPKTDG